MTEQEHAQVEFAESWVALERVLRDRCGQRVVTVERLRELGAETNDETDHAIEIRSRQTHRVVDPSVDEYKRATDELWRLVKALVV